MTPLQVLFAAPAFRGWRRRILLATLLLGLGWPLVSPAALPVFTDQLVNGWQNWGYATLNFANTNPVFSGSRSVSITIAGAWQGMQLYHPDLNSAPYASVSFWLHGGTNGGQRLQLYGLLHTTNSVNEAQAGRYYLSTLPANTWTRYVVPLAALGVAGKTNFTGFVLQDAIGSTQPTFYADDIQLDAMVPPPAVTQLVLDATRPVRGVDARWFSLNTAVWDSSLDTPQTIAWLNELGVQTLRFPGGSLSDEYHWAINRSLTNTWAWVSSIAKFIHVVTNTAAQAMITVNYGTGSTNEAAAWVAYLNGSTNNLTSLGVDAAGTNWRSISYWAALRAAAPLGTDDGRNFLRLRRAVPLDFKYWEIGNECYGGWETDSNAVPHDPYTYALRTRDYIRLMKLTDPTIKVGVVLTPGEDSFANNTLHPVVNPRTGQTHNGWTPVLLATLKQLGVTPDFGVHHRYPQNAGGENDASLLANTNGWIADAADLRQQITDYIGVTGTNIELLCTENNSVSSGPGKQTTSLVNGLFLADTLAQLMKTEFNGFFWWDLRNGQDAGYNNSASLYGWRNYGDYGIVNGTTDRYPTFHTTKLMKYFARPGDTVLASSSDNALLPAYAIRRLNGALTALIINQSPTSTFTGQVAVVGFTPGTNATLYSYGIPQDTAAQSGVGSAEVAQTNHPAATNFSVTLAPYSANVFYLPPAPPRLLALAPLPGANQFVFQLQGQAGVPYIVQTSSNLTAWAAVSTNTPAGPTLNITNPISTGPSRRFWRALWQP